MTNDIICAEEGCGTVLGTTTAEPPVVYCKAHAGNHVNPGFNPDWHDLAPRARLAAIAAAKVAAKTGKAEK